MSDIEIAVGDVWQTRANPIECEITAIETDFDGTKWITSYSEIDGVTDSCTYDELLQDYVFLRKGQKADMVNHPPHYKDASGIECCLVTDLMMFNAGNSFKYLYRFGEKFNDIEDLKKARWYAMRAYLTGDNEQPNSIEWDNNVKEIASYREGGIYKAMTAIRSYSWLAVAAFIGDEIARLESE